MALFVGDTAQVVDDSSPATILTPSKKKIKNIAIFLKDEESEEEDEEKENDPVAENPNAFGRGKRTAIVDNKLRQDTTNEEKRKSHQKELMEKMNAQALKRIKEGGDNKEEKKVSNCFKKRFINQLSRYVFGTQEHCMQ